jgi:coenzyme PQQ precursor peptide PqqA
VSIKEVPTAMKWETPTFEEITASAEVTAYVYSK